MSSSIKLQIIESTMSQLSIKYVDIKFAVPVNYKESLIKSGLRLMETKRIFDKYYDTKGLELLSAGAFLRERNDSLELKEPVNWQGSYLGYDGSMEYIVSEGMQAKEIVEKKFRSTLNKMIVICSVKFDRERWSCADCDVVIDTVSRKDDMSSYMIGELKLKNSVEDLMSNSVEKAKSYLEKMGFKRILDGKVINSLKENNCIARLKLAEMM